MRHDKAHFQAKWIRFAVENAARAREEPMP
jgi:hypothetical protein